MLYAVQVKMSNMSETVFQLQNVFTFWQCFDDWEYLSHQLPWQRNAYPGHCQAVSQSEWPKVGSVNDHQTNCQLCNWRIRMCGKTKSR